MSAVRLLVTLFAASLSFAPAAFAQTTFTFNVANDTVVYSDSLQVTVQVCPTSNPLRSQTGTLTNSAGTSSVWLSEGPPHYCSGDGYAWISDLELELGVNTFVVSVVDWSWTTHADTLRVTRVLPAEARILLVDETAVRINANATQRLMVEVMNIGIQGGSFMLHVDCAGAVASCAFTNGLDSIAFAVGAQGRSPVPVDITAGSAAGSGTAHLFVGGQPPDTATIQVTVSGSLNPYPTVRRSRDTVVVAPSTTRSIPFTIVNPNVFESRDITLSALCDSACAPSPSSVTLGAGRDTVVHVTVHVASTAPSTSWIKLIASITSPSVTKRDSLVAKVGTVTPTVTVDVASASSGAAIARDQCLSVAAGFSAGIECGALRVVHGAPPVRTMGVERAPRLLYLSSHAQPLAFVHSRVSVANVLAPDSLKATLSLHWPDTNLTTVLPWEWAWAPECATAAGCQIAFPIDVTTLNAATGYFTYDLSVSIGSGGGAPAGATSGGLIVINDRQSPFGPGWWLEGLERLQVVGGGALDSLLWIGGDGSARLYVRSGSDTTKFLASSTLTRPDTISRVGTSWRRHLRNGARVWFGPTFRHDSTVNRQGHMARFIYSTSGPARLTSIRLPKPTTSAPNRDFTFTWDTVSSPILLNSFRVPAQAGTGTRTSTVGRDSNRRITRIKDATGDSVRFVYSSSPNHRMTRRVNRLIDTTLFAYDAFGAVNSVTVRMRTDTAIVTTLCAAETRSLVTCAGDGATVRPASTSRITTRLDGPRSDVADITLFHINRFGGPDTIVNALGGRARVRRDNTSFPALATEVVDVAGLTTRLWYNSRGLPDSTTVVGPYANGNAVTRYSWHSNWDLVTRVQSPTSEVDSIGVDGATGNRAWQKRGTHDSTRVDFAYDAKNRLISMRAGSDTLTRLAYDDVVDSLGNLWRTTTGIGFRAEVRQDRVGAITSIWTPTDSAQTASLRTVQQLYRDLLGRVIADTTTAPTYDWAIRHETGTPFTGTSWAKRAIVTTTYDAESRPLTVYRNSRGWVDSTGTWSNVPFNGSSATSTFTYDAAGRTVTSSNNGTPTTFYYDRAGNPVRTVTKRGSEITATYDVLNRLTMRFTPTVSYSATTCSGCAGDAPPYGYTVRIPYYTSPIEDGLSSPDAVIPAEMTLFGYDHAGRLIEADNSQARVRRTYFVSGAVQSDETVLRHYDPFASPQFDNTHVNALTYSYDLSGRRTKVAYGFKASQTYAYDAFGQLTGTTDLPVFGAPSVNVSFTYDRHGRIATQTAGGTTATWTYDLDGRPITRTEGYFADTIRYDARGKRIRVSGRAVENGPDEVFTAAYDGIGNLIASSFTGGAWNTTDESFVDGFGHTYDRYRNRDQWEDTESFDVSTFENERLVSSTGVPRPYGATDAYGLGPAVKAYDDVALTYDAAGNVRSQASIRRSWSYSYQGSDVFVRATTGHQWTWSFYDADERPRIVQQHRVLSEPSAPLTLQHEYWYDALGRRVLTRTRADSAACGATQVTTPEVCQQAITRVYWDGDQVFREDRQAGGWQATPTQLDQTGGNSAWYGAIRTVTAGAIDVPLIVWKGNSQALVLRRNWRGNVAGATQVAGTTLSYTPQWPAAISDIRFAPDAQLGSVPANSWWGSLALDQRDATGLLYRRNRYYDPQTGRFTQSDPIGLAGGLNLYGYANGDPINYSDPFGLCPDSTSTEAQEECEEEAERDVGEEAERACAIESFRLGAGFAADALAVGAIYRGARAAGRLAANYGTNLAFRGRGMWVPQQILAGNRADIAGAVIQTGQAHAIGAAATSPIGIQADDGSVGVGDVAAAVVTAMVPFSGLPAQVARTEAACNPQ